MPFCIWKYNLCLMCVSCQPSVAVSAATDWFPINSQFKFASATHPHYNLLLDIWLSVEMISEMVWNLCRERLTTHSPCRGPFTESMNWTTLDGRSNNNNKTNSPLRFAYHMFVFQAHFNLDKPFHLITSCFSPLFFFVRRLYSTHFAEWAAAIEKIENNARAWK